MSPLCSLQLPQCQDEDTGAQGRSVSRWTPLSGELLRRSLGGGSLSANLQTEGQEVCLIG